MCSKLSSPEARIRRDCVLGRVAGEGGFTFIEILIALSLIGILFLPLMQLFTQSMVETQMTMDTITATTLAKSHMERTLNLHLTKTQLRDLGSEVYPPAGEDPLIMNKTRWRITRTVMPETDPLEVRISVARDEEPEKPLITLVTLFEDMAWESVRPIVPAAV